MDHYNEKFDRIFGRWFWAFWLICLGFTLAFWVAVIWLIVVLIQHFS